jgi:deoxyadenosine/deoxycytidine kinase
MNGKIISIEADIGAGKSTFLRLLNTYYGDKICVIYEPLEEWLRQTNDKGENILQLMYQDPKRWSYTFQHNAFLTRVQKIERERDDTKIIVTERSPLSDYNVFAKMLKDQGLVDSLEYSIYLNWMGFLNERYKTTPSKVIYLRTTPEMAYQRLRKRSRKEEDTVSLEYLKQVNAYHETWMESLRTDPTTQLIEFDGNVEFETNLDVFHVMAAKLFE